MSRWASSSRIGTALPSRRPEPIISRPKTAIKEDVTFDQQHFLSPHARPTQQQGGGRPSSSLIRPLSGKIFMRRTVKNGWVAKGIDERSSVIDLEREEGLDEEEPLGSDAGSLDSFFDDDFEEKDLGNLLSCNTLGIESKGHRPDWRSGDLAIPEFHCPRCRDHWYGLTSYPCDEELARLIREGKWYTGKDGTKPSRGDTATRERSKDSKDGTNGSTDSLTLPSITKKRGSSAFQTNKSNHRIDFVTPGSRNDKKKTRRITFKLEGDDLDNDASNSSLNDTGDEDWSQRRRTSKANGSQRSRLKDRGDGSEFTDDESKKSLGSASSLSDMNSGSSATLLKGGKGDWDKKGRGGRNSGDESGNNGSGQHGLGKKGRGGRGGEEKEGSLTSLSKDSRSGNGLGESNQSKLLKSSRAKYLNDQSTDPNNKESLHSNNQDGSGRNTMSDNLGDNTNGSDANGIGNGTSDGSGLNDGARGGRDGGGRGKGGRGRNSGYNSQTSSQRGSRTNLLNGGGGGKERELVHGKGYMRASSPSQSDWGDPTHARIWASNTASSSRVSLAATSRHDDEEDDESPKEFVLPPIIHQKRQNPFSSLDFMDGFELTRAYTFSYHS